jgi:DNA-directed RNA polymerase subunit M
VRLSVADRRKLRFCPKCGSRLVPVKKAKSIVLSCPSCEYETRKPERSIQPVKTEKENIIVIGREEQKIRTLPKMKVECPKCGHMEAFYWLVQTRGADESSTQFFRCASCGATWRETS